MRIFIRVVERGSMSAAARDLGIGQPAVSERIEKLEAHLGTRLLRRNTRNMSLTQSGNVFYERSKTAVQAAEHALSVNEENQGLQGKIRIAAPYSAGESLLMPALLQLQNEHPELQVDVIFNDRVINPVTEGVDLSLRLGDVSEGFFVARPLGTVRRVLLASPALLAKADGALIPLLSHYPIPPFSAWLLHPPAGMMSYETRICASLLEGYIRDLLLEPAG